MASTTIASAANNVQMPEPAHKKPVSFLDFPAELRNQVYEEVKSIILEEKYGNVYTEKSPEDFAATVEEWDMPLHVLQCHPLESPTLSHVSQKVRAEWTSFFHIHTALYINLEHSQNAWGWLNAFGESRLPIIKTFTLEDCDLKVHISFDHDLYDVAVSTRKHTHLRKSGGRRDSQLCERWCRHAENGIRTLLDRELEVAGDGALRMPSSTLQRILHGSRHDFRSIEYQYLCEQHGGVEKELPITWLSHVEVALTKKRALKTLSSTPLIDVVLAGMAEAGGPENEPLPFEAPLGTTEETTEKTKHWRSCRKLRCSHRGWEERKSLGWFSGPAHRTWMHGI